jgi:hypothetical protein
MTRNELEIIATALGPVVREYVLKAETDSGLRDRLFALEARTDAAYAAIEDHAIGAMRERLAVLETRAPIPGPPGAAGKDGVDGVGFDDLLVEQMDETTVTIKAKRGEVVKVIGSVTFPVVTFKGDYEAGCEYLPGNLVRTKSAIWHCRVATTIAPDAVTYDTHGKPAGPQGKDFWTLVLSERRRG